MKDDLNNSKNSSLVTVWGEHINIKSFIFGLLFSVTTLLLVVVLIPGTKDAKLIYGLITVIVTFVINAILIKPKRNIIVVKDNKNDN